MALRPYEYEHVRVTFLFREILVRIVHIYVAYVRCGPFDALTNAIVS